MFSFGGTETEICWTHNIPEICCLPFWHFSSTQISQPCQVLHASFHWEASNQNGISTEKVAAQCQLWQRQCLGISSFQNQMGSIQSPCLCNQWCYKEISLV